MARGRSSHLSFRRIGREFSRLRVFSQRGYVTGRPKAVDLTLEKQVQSVCRWGIAQGMIQSAHDCSEGGLAVTLAECCLSSALSCTIDLSVISSGQSILSLLFGESLVVLLYRSLLIGN